MPTVIITFLLKQEDIVEAESNYIFSNITYFFLCVRNFLNDNTLKGLS